MLIKVGEFCQLMNREWGPPPTPHTAIIRPFPPHPHFSLITLAWNELTYYSRLEWDIILRDNKFAHDCWLKIYAKSDCTIRCISENLCEDIWLAVSIRVTAWCGSVRYRVSDPPPLRPRPDIALITL